jgi:hypothetical protein
VCDVGDATWNFKQARRMASIRHRSSGCSSNLDIFERKNEFRDLSDGRWTSFDASLQEKFAPSASGSMQYACDFSKVTRRL